MTLKTASSSHPEEPTIGADDLSSAWEDFFLLEGAGTCPCSLEEGRLEPFSNFPFFEVVDIVAKEKISLRLTKQKQ